MKFTKIPADTFQKLQINAGILTTDFTPATGTIGEAGQIGATTGGISYSATPTYKDYGEDIDNCPKNVQYSYQLKQNVAILTRNRGFAPLNCAPKLQAVPAYSPKLCAKCAPRKESGGVVKLVKGQLWYCCPVCGQKLHKLAPDAVCNGVTTFCKKCKWEGVMNIKERKGA